MNIILKNTNHFAYMITYYLGLALFSYAAILAPNVEYINIYSMIFLNTCLFFFIVGILVYLAKIPVTFSVSEKDLRFKTWKYFFIKEEKYNLNDVERIDVLKGMISAAKLNIVFKNGQSKKIGFELYNEIVGDLADVKLSESAPQDLISQLAIKVGKTVSVRTKIPFDTIYVADAWI